MSRLRALALAMVLGAPGPAFGAEPPPTTEATVLARAAERSPTLRAALIQLRDATTAVAGEEARFPWTVLVDANATRTASPRLIQGENVVGQVYSVDGTAQLQKRLEWGTDLAFSLRSAWQNSVLPASLQFVGLAPNGAIPTVAFSARAGVTQPLLRGAGSDVTLATLHLSRAQKTQAGRAAERVASALLRDVSLAYWDLWYAEEAARIQARSRDVAVAERDQAAARVATGSLAPADALPFETRVAMRDEELVAARLEIERQRIALAGRAGLLGGSLELGSPAEDAPEPPPEPSAADLEREAIAISPELGELRAAVEVARVQRRTAGDSGRPRLDANAFLQLDGLGSADAGAALGQLATFGAWSAHAGLSFDAPLDAGRRKADLGRARAAVELAEARLEERTQQLVGDLRTALAREAGARTRITLAVGTAERAEHQLEAERQRQRTGSGTPLQVLQAEDEVRNARLRLARARVDALQQAVVRDHLGGRLIARHADLLARGLGPRESRLRGVFEAARY